MAAWSFPWRLNIRQKVIAGLSAGILGISFIGILSYHYLHEIELKQRLAEIAEDLRDRVLEMRRYEKNYLLYGDQSDLKENYAYTQGALEIVEKFSQEGQHLQVVPLLQEVKKELLIYRRLMQEKAAKAGHQGLNPHKWEDSEVPLDEHPHLKEEHDEHLRLHGKRLVDLSQQVVSFERQRILDIIKTLKTQLFASIILFLFFGGFLGFIVAHKIIRPLRVIESTTRRIARGNFKPLPVLDTRDETQQVVEAFNRMVKELERRQDQLVQSKKMSSIGVLTAGVAHQLNNPLNNISTSCQILLEELEMGDKEFFRRLLSNMEQEVNRARDIVKGLLEFSRAREFSPQPTPLAQVVSRSVKLISSQVPPGISIVQEVPEDLILTLDAQHLQEVFLNLLMNAIQAIEEPPGEIRIAARLDPEGKQAVIVVEDNGCGIPPELLDRIFDPFFTTKEVGLGTGLGLSIVYGIIEKHQGSISVESRVGEGTRFTIRLPWRPSLNQGSASL